MQVPFLDLSRRIAAGRGELDAAWAASLDGGRFVFGAAVAEFEAAFAAYCGVGHAVGVASGTDAITIALQAVGVVPGDEVITVANTCAPTIAGIEAAGARAVLVEVDPLTYTLAPETLDAARTEHTRVVLPVHLYGQCADMDAIVSFARAHGLKVVEDAAQAHGATFQGRRAGSLADAAAFSFYPTKNLGALGDAGAVVTAHAEVAERARALRNYGERERYCSLVPGWNSRLDTIQAAALLVQLPRLDAWNERRRRLAHWYDAELADVGLGLPGEGEARLHVYHLYVVRSRERARVREALAAAGVETLVHYPLPVHRQPAYESLSRPGTLALTEALCEEVFSLPLYPELTDSEAEQVVCAVRQAAR